MQALGQPVQRPAVVGIPPQILPVDGLGLGWPAGVEQHRPERLADRIIPGGRLAVAQPVLAGDRFFELPNCLVGLARPGRQFSSHDPDGNPQQIGGRIAAHHLPPRVKRRQHRVQLSLLGSGLIQPLGGGKGQSPGVVPQPGHIAQIRRRSGLLEHRLPLAEADQRTQRHGRPGLKGGKPPGALDRDALGQLAGRFNGFDAAAFHVLGSPQEVDVVGVVHVRVHPPWGFSLDIGLVGLNRPGIAERRVVVQAEAHIDMRGHVDQMAGTRNQLAQPAGVGQGAFGLRRGFNRVDIVVDSPDVVGKALQDTLQSRHELQGVGFGLTLGGPVVPGPDIHQRGRKQGPGVRIVRVALGQATHGLGIGAVQGVAVGAFRFGHIPGGQGFNIGPVVLAGISGQDDCLLHRGIRLSAAPIIHRCVDIWPQGQGQPPVSHGAAWVDLRHVSKGPNRLGVVEPVHQPQPLVKVALGQF